MKTTTKSNRNIQIDKESAQWRIQQAFGKFVGKLDRLPDAGEVQRNPLQSAPQDIAGMVF